MQQPQIMQQLPVMQDVSLVLPPELQPSPITFIPSISSNFSQIMTEQIQPPTTTITPTTITPTTITPTTTSPTTELPVHEMSNKFEFKDVPYGCLRNGNKPTYRTYHRNQNAHVQNNHNTTLKKPLFGQTATAEHQDVDPIIQERQRKLREIQANNHIMRHPTVNNEVNDHDNNETKPYENDSPQTPQPTKIKKEIKQTITKKYKLGKAANGKVVGVLIKNSDTRRRIQEEHGILRRESIVEIRKYLHDHGLIKVGSDAPPDVLRNLYESAKMTGDVNNTNKDVILHNFMKSDENTTNN